MNKWTVPAVVVAGVAALAFLWPSGEAVSPAPSPAQTEQTYILFVRDLGFSGSDKELTDLGKGVCSVLDEYGADTTLLALAKPDNVTVDQYAGVLVASVTTYCPYHEKELLG